MASCSDMVDVASEMQHILGQWRLVTDLISHIEEVQRQLLVRLKKAHLNGQSAFKYSLGLRLLGLCQVEPTLTAIANTLLTRAQNLARSLLQEAGRPTAPPTEAEPEVAEDNHYLANAAMASFVCYDVRGRGE